MAMACIRYMEARIDKRGVGGCLVANMSETPEEAEVRLTAKEATGISWTAIAISVIILFMCLMFIGELI